MMYFTKSFFAILLYIVLSFTKGWMLFILLFMGLPVLAVWFLLLGIIGRRNIGLRDKVFTQTTIAALVVSFTMPGAGDTEDATAFTFIMTKTNSALFTATNIVCLLAMCVFLLAALKGAVQLLRSH